MSAYENERTLDQARNSPYAIPEQQLHNSLLAAILDELILARKHREQQLVASVTGSAAPVIPDWMGGKKKTEDGSSHSHNAHLYGDDNGLRDTD